MNCPAGEAPTGGGAVGRENTFVNSSAATTDGGRWEVRGTNTGGFAQMLAAQVICTAP
ncbi:hypothetical protein [Kitasatospora sp. GP82]|uniref:hypothetical protein n=1 Tax=Kitasatospora sp. GP82 TaxID=3035089 RepID=UPI0024731836|nr:hypothetical protein [Kitasatospora sp. GP82]